MADVDALRKQITERLLELKQSLIQSEQVKLTQEEKQAYEEAIWKQVWEGGTGVPVFNQQLLNIEKLEAVKEKIRRNPIEIKKKRYTEQLAKLKAAIEEYVKKDDNLDEFTFTFDWGN